MNIPCSLASPGNCDFKKYLKNIKDWFGNVSTPLIPHLAYE